MSMLVTPQPYLRQTQVDPEPPPALVSGPIAWVRAHLLSSPLNIAMTVITLYLAYLIFMPLIKFALIDAVWTGQDREACLAGPGGGEVGACWAYVGAKLSYFIYGSYPWEQRWRVDIFFVLTAIGVVWMLWLDAPRRNLGAIYFFIVYPIVSFILLSGWNAVGLSTVDTSLWGGILVTLIVSIVGIVFSLPFGVVLALGRRSALPAIRLASVIFIEVIRGVPLITVLFMANTMLPLFLPGNMTPDRLLRPLVGVAIFAAAYMAEVVRGGLQAIPKGQYEGAMSLGLGYWTMMRLVVLPQALRIVIPGIVNVFIALFKDTTLVSIVGIFDLLRTIEATLTDPTWSTPTTRFSGYAFAAVFYFIFCFGMSRYSLAIERRFARGHKR
ncbi:MULTISPECIES: amino acid ABC transporter permease [unclassified Chelatococcus]|uniref:amino acid ABC transporter permease n=1 Tax=unclassified Chelatococcus TaxID=2638111 RepID=UPI001BCD26EA|nr:MULTISPECIES: amino acid ABC transporter permease [unclassified Chelatococcus]MBS7699494.1 amino acid ABC transporter permease [Chelatococcus sp. YT9]MBX3559587.1 amino acid ABC transporter permease [Chelatococcus sp.]